MENMVDIKKKLYEKYPYHIVAFDVIFESDGSLVPYHVDYESLGPFIVESPIKSIANEDFLSVHFNLTTNGGSLKSYNGVILSYIHYQTIVMFGIYSFFHKLVTFLSVPFLIFAYEFPNSVGYGNVFNNMKLHCVTSGSPRISYVVRMVKKDVNLSKKSVKMGIQRSNACKAFKYLMDYVPNEKVTSEKIHWESILSDNK
tara:strand:+ start:22 stop:621 length:600 start_codon:yes stop_codon:yes gene_type:complete